MFLQVVNHLASVGLRNVVDLGSPREAAQIDDVAEDFQEAKVHGSVRWYRIGHNVDIRGRGHEFVVVARVGG
jgi:hypothetical protein